MPKTKVSKEKTEADHKESPSAMVLVESIDPGKRLWEKNHKQPARKKPPAKQRDKNSPTHGPMVMKVNQDSARDQTYGSCTKR